MAIAHSRHSFVEASLLCALLELGAADGPTKTTGGILRRRNLPEAAFPKSTLHRVSNRLISDGVLTASVYKNTRTTYSVEVSWLDETLAARGPDQDALKALSLVTAMHHLQDYDEALMLCRLLDLPADSLPALRLAELIEPIAGQIDRHRARRALYRLAEHGLVTLAPKDRSGLGVTVMADAAAELLARPMHDLRYLRPDAYASQPYFVARAARLASAVADDQSVELGAAPLPVSDVELRAGLPVSAAQSEAVGDSAPSSCST